MQAVLQLGTLEAQRGFFGRIEAVVPIAASYIAGTKIIVLDEPSSNLDIKSISVLAKMLKILKEKGISIIVAEHRIYYLVDIVDRVFLIDKGKLKKIYRRSEFLKLDKNELKALSLRDKELSKLEVPYLEKGEDFFVSSSFFSIMGLLQKPFFL